MSNKPNILIFNVDQMTGGVVGRQHQCIMPAARRLATEGVSFTNTYCVTPHCCPSRASFQTGEYPSIHGVWNNVSNRCAINRGLNPEIKTLGQHLKTAGYDLLYAGKWHVSDIESPSAHGWTEFRYGPPMGAWTTSRIKKFEQNGISCSGIISRPGWGGYSPYGVIKDDKENDLMYREIVCATVEKLQSNLQQNTPWAMMVSCNVPHDPYVVPEKYLRLYDNMEISLPPSYSDSLEDKPRIYQRMRRQIWDQMDEEQAKECLKHYWASCTMVDTWLGMLLDALDQSDKAENTIVVFTSDHGDYCGAHGLWCKGIPAFKEGYHIPNIIRWPAMTTNKGREVDALVSICDIMPTLIEAATGNAPDVFGKSLLAWLQDENRPGTWRDELNFQMNGVELYYTQRSVMTQKWKYVYNGFDFDELYDLENDPGETFNLANPELYTQNKPSARAPYPAMPSDLEIVRKDMHQRMWKFAREQRDHTLYTPYITTGLACYGPGIASS